MWELILILIGLFIVPLYSAYVMEWRIKKYTKKYKLEEILIKIEKLIEKLEGI